jgi:hypothetical protein
MKGVFGVSLELLFKTYFIQLNMYELCLIYPKEGMQGFTLHLLFLTEFN